MAIPVSSSLTQLNAELFLKEGFELSLDAIIPSIELTGSFTPFESKTQFFIYNYAKEIIHSNLSYNANGSYLSSPPGTSTSNNIENYNQFELDPPQDVYDQGYSNGNYYAVYNFINYELGSENNVGIKNEIGITTYNGYPYFIKDISGDRTELRIQNNFLSSTQIENYYNTFKNKIDLRTNADEFYISFGDNRNFIGVNTKLELPVTGSSNATSILIKLYKPLPAEFEVDANIQIISKIGETQAFGVEFKPNLEFVDNLLSLKGPNYNIDLKDRVNNSTNFKNLNDLINTNSSESYYQFNTLRDKKGITLQKNWGDWSQFVKYSSAEQRLNNFREKLVTIESHTAYLSELSAISALSKTTLSFSSSYNSTSQKINQIISKFDSYEYFLYYVNGDQSWPKLNTTGYPYINTSVTSSEALNWFGSTNEQNQYYNSGKNQIYSASRYDNNNQDYLYYLIPPYITENSSNDQYISFVNMTGQAFDEMYLYTEAVEQVRNTNSGLTGSVLPLGLADEVIESLGFDTYANSFNSTGFNVNNIGVFPATGSGLEYITRYIDIASGSVINYYDQQQSTLGFVVALADPSFPYPLNNAAQEIYKRIFHNMVSLVKRKGTVTGLRQLINIWGVPNTMLRISEFGGKNKNDENDYDLWMNRYSNSMSTINNLSASIVGGAQAVLNNTFTGTDPGWDGIDNADISDYRWNYNINTDTSGGGVTYVEQKFVITSDASLQDQVVGASSDVIAFFQGTTTSDRATNLAQAMNSTNSSIKSFASIYAVNNIINYLHNDVGTYGNSSQMAMYGNATAMMTITPTRSGTGGINGTTINGGTEPSGSIRIPWQPLTGNYVDGNSSSPNYYSVPDCIQFRFKPQQPTSATANFSQSLLVKGNLYNGEADFALTLSYSGSQSGSFSGSVLPNNNQYGNLVFYLSGSLSDNGTVRTSPITLPFFDGNWWSVQLQRLTNISASNENNTNQTWELRAANNIYDGYNGNQIGFSRKVTRSKTSSDPSYNFAWNTTHNVTVLSPNGNSFAKGYSAIALGGMMQSPGAPNQFMGTSQWSPSTKINIGDGFLGDFQEFRYYRRALSASQFNDYVMNPESIQGHSDSTTGAGSSYDLLSFRLPLGNELEYTEVSGSANDVDWNNAQGGQVKFLSFGGNSFFAGGNAFGSLHPSLVNKQGSLFTSSFILTTNVTTSQYGIAYQGRTGAYTSAITSSYLKPNTEINYMDQPAAGIRNRIKNKIQVIDGNEYGTTLSPFRSIQQEFEQSSSYTEDLNSLEVGFSFQNEINDDIIATFGHGVVSDAIADPRFISESSDRYPELTRIAEDYFKKYQGVTIDDPTYNGGLPTIIEKEYDYNRLIKFYETSLFKAIKNYVPARTSLSTGIIVKQHLLERNKTNAVIGMTINTPIAKTPETGSDSWGYTNETGFNSIISQQNLLITSSLEMYSLTGSAGGSVNKYNNLTINTPNFNLSHPYLTFYASYNPLPIVPSTGTISLLNPQQFINIFTSHLNVYLEGDGFLATDAAFEGQLHLQINYNSVVTNNINFQLVSNKRGVISTFTQAVTNGAQTSAIFDPLFNIYPDEEVKLLASVDTGTLTLQNLQAIIGKVDEAGYNTIDNLQVSSSQQVNWYRDNYTGLLKVKDTQEEFYNGELSGSNIPVELNEYNPYRIFADGSNLSPDEINENPGLTPPVVNLAAGPYDATRFPTVTSNSATSLPIRATGSLLQYSGSYNGSTSGDALLIQDVSPNLNNAYQWVKIISEDGVTRTYNSIGTSNNRFDINTYPAQKEQFILSEETDIFRTQTDGGSFNGTVTTAGTGTFNLTDQYGKKIEIALQWNGNTVQSATITNNNLGNDNGSLWPKTDSVFTEDDAIAFSGFILSFTLSPAASYNNLPGFGVPNLLMVQVVFSGGGQSIQANLTAAILSTNGHNGSLLATVHYNQGSSNRQSIQLFNTYVGNTYANAIQGSTQGSNDFADNSGGICILDEGGAVGDYYFPTTLQQGVNQPAFSTIYLPNSITNLTPGITYNISFDITNYQTDGISSPFGDNSNFDVGLSSADAPGGTPNGIGLLARATSNAAISHSWVQAAGTSTAAFFSAYGVYANVTNFNIIVPPSVLGPKHFYEFDSFTIMPTSSFLFANSPYNPIINNVSGSRPNSFLLDQDFKPPSPSFIKGALTRNEGLPSDYQFLASASQLGWEGVATNNNLLEFSDVPDSNYTTKTIINPRYNGSKITSADYNFRISEASLSESAAPNSLISPLRLPGLQESSKIRFLNGEIGSWGGDSTNEYQSAIDSRPIYFAHFKSSYENYELYNSTTFDIDQLIQVPFNSIQGEQAPIITSSQLNGNNENLLAVGSTFLPNRKLKAFYNQATKQFRNLDKHLSPTTSIKISPILDYTIGDTNSNYIIFPAQEVLSYYTNEKTQQEVVLTHSINAPIWVKDSINYVPSIGAGKPIWQVINTRNNGALGSLSTPLTQSIQPLPLNTFSASTSLLVTGSSPSGNASGYGLLYLQGMSINGEDLYQYNFGSVSPDIRSMDLSAPHLQLINSINQNIDIGDISYSTSLTPYLFPDGTVNTQITNSCAQWPPNEGDPFAPWPLTVSTFVQSPINPTSQTNSRKGGGLPSFPSNPLKSTAKKGIQNYFTYNYSMSVLTEYTEKTLPIMIERGDEIRISYSFPLLTDVVSNASKTNEIVNQTFTVLGYEQAPPSLLFGKPLEYNGSSKLGWSSNEAMVATFGVGSNEFEAIAGNLPPTGLYSPDSLKERFDLLATNQQNVIGLGLSTNDVWLNTFTGSIVSCKVESRWGEISGSSTTVAPTGSIRVKFRGYHGAIGSNANRVCQIQSVQEILRTTMGGASGSYQEALNNPVPSSQYQFIVNDGSDYHPIDPGFIFDTLKVTPNPSTLLKPIPNGSIMSATFKKRIDNDTKVVVNMVQPPENEGALTPSGDGYLIPDDLTSTQMDNVQKIINVLKSQNSFTNPPDANETQDVS